MNQCIAHENIRQYPTLGRIITNFLNFEGITKDTELTGLTPRARKEA